MAKQAAARPVGAKAPGKEGVIQRTRRFIVDVKIELDKVTWPTRQDLKASTSVVLIFLGILAIMIGGMDVVFQNIVILLFRLA